MLLSEVFLHIVDFTQPQQKYAGTGENGNFEIAAVFQNEIKIL